MQYDLLCNQSNQKNIIIVSSPLILGGLSNLEINQAKDAQQLPCFQTVQLKLARLINSRMAPSRLVPAASSPELVLGSQGGKHLGNPGSLALTPSVLQKAQSQLSPHVLVFFVTHPDLTGWLPRDVPSHSQTGRRVSWIKPQFQV